MSTLAARYLESRAIRRWCSGSIRFHPALRHRCGTTHPALLALVVDVHGQPMAVMRIYLERTRSGVIKVSCSAPAKMMLGAVAGGAVRTGPPAERILVGEGLESTLSAAELLGIDAAWAALSANGIERLELPESVRAVTIAADRDPVGIEAARKAARRWTREGREIRIRVPAQPFDDWNDQLVALRVSKECA